MPQFVLLEHDHPQLHWDFMLEAATVLRTWRLSQIPDRAGSIPAEHLADHRLAYLDYEGPVSGNRGSVRRIDRGEFRMLEESSSALICELAGQKLRGIARLEKAEAESAAWCFHWRLFESEGS